MTPAPWKLDEPFKELDAHLENAYKRVAGIVGFKMNQDRINLEALAGSARDIVDWNVAPTEPFFMRLGRSVHSVATYRPKGTLSLKELAAEVLDEFYREGTGAFQAVRVRLHGGAAAWLQDLGLSEERRRAVLAAAEDSLLPPSREEMTRQAMPFVQETVTPGTLAIVGGFAGFGLVIATLRHPLLAAVGAGGGAALAYYLARNRLRTRAQTLLTKLPQELYSLLRQSTVANQTRYQDIINQARA